MWYAESDKVLEYSKPIVAEDSNGNKQILVPTLGEEGYDIVGYDWLSLEDGEHTSCSHFKTAREAVISREKGYKVYNANLAIKEI
jgi:hypothetical protein